MGLVRLPKIVVAFVLSIGGLAAAIPLAQPASAVPNYDDMFTLSDGPVDFGPFGSISAPTISPDGLWSMYFKNHQLHTVPTGGGRERLIDARAIGNPYDVLAISPDSSRIVYNDEAGLASQAIAGSPEVRLLAGTQFDGLKIVGSYVLVEDSIFAPNPNVWSIPIDGGAAVRLNPPLTATGKLQDVSVSPDGQRVAFVASLAGEPMALYEVPITGGTATQISTPITGGEVSEIEGFSPNGAYLIYHGTRATPGSDMYSVGVDKVVRKFNSGVGSFSNKRSFQFDDTSIYGTVTLADGPHVFRANVDGTNFTTIYRALPVGTATIWSFDLVATSGRLVVQTRNGTVADLISMAVDGTGVIALYPGYNPSNGHAIAPDGLTVVASSGTGPLLKRPIDGSAPGVPITSFGATVVQFKASGTAVFVSRGRSPWIAYLDDRPPAEIAPVSGTIDNRAFSVSPDGRRVIVVQDRFVVGRYGAYSFGPSSADGNHTTFVPLAPKRILDTRPGEQVGYTGAKPTPGAVVRLPVRGVAGIPNTADVKAVVLNVTAVDATAGGFVTVWPTGTPQPLASNLNLESSGQTRPNLVTVQVRADGAVSLFTSSGAHLLADVAGYYTFAANARGGRMFPLPPTRILDTRSGTRPTAGAALRLPVLGRGGVPGTGVSAVVLNVTATDAARAGYVTVWPSGTERPVASNLNLEFAGQSIPNQVIVPVGPDGSVAFFTDGGTHLITDVAGWFSNGDEGTGNSGLFIPVSPFRVLDTRPNSLKNWSGAKPGPGALVPLTYGSPGDGMSAYALNLTMAEATTPGFVTAYPAGQLRPDASNLNASTAGQTIPNHVTMAVDGSAKVTLYTNSGAHLIGDVNGVYFS
jgi:Tol biopolymer transport system component